MEQNRGTVTLYTPEGEARSVGTTPWQTYPRPHLQRDSFLCLNGTWELSVLPRGTEPPIYEGPICVPFVPQSPLSGVEATIPKGACLRYRRIVSLPNGFRRDRTLLYVDGADAIAEVIFNGQSLGAHHGGYERFGFDVTHLLQQENQVEIRVTEAPKETLLPYGKQRSKRGGMWYTPVSGIWQTVWMESVPEGYVEELCFATDLTGATLTARSADGTPCEGTVTLRLPEGDRSVPLREGRARIDVPSPILWSPEQPHLYRVTVETGADRVSSYFALRTLETREVNGIPRLCLNGKPYFFHGLLDQGYFSDGIFLPADPTGYERDILAAKRMGFNLLRKHIKVEPEVFYYACDRLGMAVAQDMVNNGRYSFLRDTALPTVGFRRRSDRRLHPDREERRAFLAGMEATVRQLSHHPCICAWTIFNEGWGQFDHAAAYARLRAMDDTRFIDSVSGWFLPPKGRELQSDVESLHVYFKPVRLPRRAAKPLVLSEFGGYSHRVKGHCFNLNKNYGYRTFAEQEELEEALIRLYEDEIIPAARAGLCAAVYTQLTDVEDETNGLLTYDRRVEKVSAARMQAIAEALRTAVEHS